MIGHLPGAIGHASALNLNGTVLVAGGKQQQRSQGPLAAQGVQKPELPGAG